MPFVGLTGNLGAGKTTVLKHFRNLGAYTINADELVHEILKKPLIIKKLSSFLGKEILIKRNSKILIDRKKMAEVIFNNPQKRKVAEKIIHPEVIKTAEKIKTKILSKKPETLIIFEVPLLFEGGYSQTRSDSPVAKKIFDKVIVVYCSRTKVINRLKKRGLSEKQTLKRIRAQMPISRKKAAADFLINNNSNIANLKTQVQAIFKKITNRK